MLRVWLGALIDMELLMEYLAKGFVTMLTITVPCVLVAASIGLVVGILQAVTQVQEQTIAAAPKIILVFTTIILLGGWYVKVLTDYFVEGTNLAFNIVPKSDNYVLPANYYRHTKPFSGEMKDVINKGGGKTEHMLKNPGKIPYSQQQNKTRLTPTTRGSGPSLNFIERNRIMQR